MRSIIKWLIAFAALVAVVIVFLILRASPRNEPSEDWYLYRGMDLRRVGQLHSINLMDASDEQLAEWVSRDPTDCFVFAIKADGVCIPLYPNGEHCPTQGNTHREAVQSILGSFADRFGLVPGCALLDVDDDATVSGIVETLDVLAGWGVSTRAFVAPGPARAAVAALPLMRHGDLVGQELHEDESLPEPQFRSVER